ncbi:MAG TPA: MerR family transcriptional regulator [Telluria sp.]|nr:MerR family transcriptional regulator [Telluria sp.]
MTNPPPAPAVPIAAVERDTGIGKDTLRAWERRYGFPRPGRDANGDRIYPPDQVARLRVVKRLLDKGHRPGKLLALDQQELEALSEAAFDEDVPGSRGAVSEDVLAYLELCRLDRVEMLRKALTQAMVRVGLRSFVQDIVAPLVTAVGECWERGRFQVYEEHLFTEVLQNVLRVGIANLPKPAAGARPQILLTTFPQEHHTLGLLMAEAMFALEGARCVSLGASTPIADISRAAAGMDIVALSFSLASNSTQVLYGLSELAASLPPSTAIWAGGSASALGRCTLPSFQRAELYTAAALVARWRDQAGGQSPAGTIPSPASL